MMTTEHGPTPASAVPARTDHRSVRRTRGLRALAVTGAGAAALVVWAVADAIAGTEPAARMNGTVGPVGPGAVLISALLAGLAGWALLAALERVGRHARRTWTVVAVVVLVLSLVGPLGSGVHTGSVLALAAMHLAVGAVLIPVLRSSARR